MFSRCLIALVLLFSSTLWSAPVRTRPKARVRVAQKSLAPTSKGAPAHALPMAPYRGALALDADSGRILFADHADRTGYPASVTKLMTFLLVQEDLARGLYTLKDHAAASTYAASMEPSKIDLRPGETCPIEELLYALMIKSANDAAIILAEHSEWARTGAHTPIPQDTLSRTRVAHFVARMNARAKLLGMTSTRYESPNGLPPGRKDARGFDTSTAQDLGKLARKLVSQKNTFTFTSPVFHTITLSEGKSIRLQNHNYFLPGSHDPKGFGKPVPGCDGLKTGYTAVSGSSIVLTAHKGARRVIVVVLGSAGRQTREEAASRILHDALLAISW